MTSLLTNSITFEIFVIAPQKNITTKLKKIRFYVQFKLRIVIFLSGEIEDSKVFEIN
jgi:hypothetical protein